MINPVADQCEANGVPCLSTLAPWQPYFLGRGGDPAVGFDWTYHFFWGADQLVGNFVDMWNTIPTNKVVGLFAPNDPDGNALADANTGFPAGAAAGGYEMVDAGRYETLTDDFTSIISEFKEKNVEIVVGIPIPPDFATFWTQAKQQGFNPKLITVAKAVLFPGAVEALGDDGDGLASEIWWTPTHPFSSSLTGTTAQELSDQYSAATGKQWTQFVGFVHALFEVALDVLARAGSTDKQAIADAAAATSLDTIVGPLRFGDGVPKNISKTSLVGGQWQKTDGGEFPFDLVVTNNSLSPEIPTGGTLEAAGLIQARSTTPHGFHDGDRVCAALRRLRRVTVEDQLSLRRCRGRSPRHRRAQRGRQDHPAQPDRRRPARERRLDHLRRHVRSRRSLRTSALRWGSGAPPRSPDPSNA